MWQECLSIYAFHILLAAQPAMPPLTSFANLAAQQQFVQPSVQQDTKPNMTAENALQLLLQRKTINIYVTCGAFATVHMIVDDYGNYEIINTDFRYILSCYVNNTSQFLSNYTGEVISY